VHVLVHKPGAVSALANGTLRSVEAAHVGQVFFDQVLIDEVEGTAAYRANTQPLTPNDRDGVLAQEADGSDPFAQYAFVQDSDVGRGVVAWLSFGIDVNAERTVYAAEWFAGPSGTEVAGDSPGTSVSSATSSSGARRRFG
jgi:hypothetical protein